MASPQSSSSELVPLERDDHDHDHDHNGQLASRTSTGASDDLEPSPERSPSRRSVPVHVDDEALIGERAQSALFYEQVQQLPKTGRPRSQSVHQRIMSAINTSSYSPSNPADMPTHGFATWKNESFDLVLAIDYNVSGTRLVTGSADHKIQVFDVNERGKLCLIDRWTAHNASISAVKWNGPGMGQVIGSVAEDMKFKLWQEDLTQAPHSGRRFRCIYSQSPRSRQPYVSLDFKIIGSETFIALATRDGIISLLEPIDPDNLASWKEVEQFYAWQKPGLTRGEETNFKLSFHPDKLPCFNATTAGLSKNALSLAVASMDSVRVYRAEKAGTGDYHFEQVATLACHEGLVRDVAWAPGSARGSDWIASSCADGYVRIFELSTPHDHDFSSLSMHEPSSTAQTGASQTAASRNTVSGISTAVAGMARAKGQSGQGDHGGQVKHEVKMLAELQHDNVWDINWIPNTSMLVSGGDDGQIRMWKASMDGEWVEFAELGSRSRRT